MAQKKLNIRTLDNEIKRRHKQDLFKGDESDIDKQEAYIAQVTKENNRRRYQATKLKKEQIKKGTPGERVKEIDKILKTPDYQPIPLTGEYNYLSMLKGKDFYHVVDNGFERYKIKHSTLMKQENPSLEFVKQMVKDAKESEINTKLKLNNTRLKSSERQRLKGTLKGLKKIIKIAEENEAALSSGNFDDIETGIRGDDRYILLVLILGETIRINA